MVDNGKITSCNSSYREEHAGEVAWALQEESNQLSFASVLFVLRFLVNKKLLTE